MSAVLKQEMSTIGASSPAKAARRRRAAMGGDAAAVLAWLGQGLNTGSEAFQAALKQREAIQSAKETRAEKLGAAAYVAAPSTPAAGPRGGSTCTAATAGLRRRAPPPTRGPPRHQRQRHGRAADVQRGVLARLATPGGAGVRRHRHRHEWDDDAAAAGQRR